ncbi:unnamed protein product [Prorocentrum cordatum]|uniref:Cellulase n=1 Tax=Prorocentrum cordatum TaxID=2364126 RepID=A0ABN9S5F7_9DINO|nr:unnamed protein product [Polarella glacialis]
MVPGDDGEPSCDVDERARLVPGEEARRWRAGAACGQEGPAAPRRRGLPPSALGLARRPAAGPRRASCARAAAAMAAFGLAAGLAAAAWRGPPAAAAASGRRGGVRATGLRAAVNLGASPGEASAPPPVEVGNTTSEPFDCDAGYSNWEAAWSDKKKEWCCDKKQMGCTTKVPPGGGAAPASTSGPPLPPGGGDDSAPLTTDSGGEDTTDGDVAPGAAAHDAPPPPDGGGQPAPATAPSDKGVILVVDTSVAGPIPGAPCECTETVLDGSFAPGDPGAYGTCEAGEVGCCARSNYVKCDGAAVLMPTSSVAALPAGGMPSDDGTVPAPASTLATVADHRVMALCRDPARRLPHYHRTKWEPPLLPMTSHPTARAGTRCMVMACPFRHQPAVARRSPIAAAASCYHQTARLLTMAHRRQPTTLPMVLRQDPAARCSPCRQTRHP